jgi:hypothetical protein
MVGKSSPAITFAPNDQIIFMSISLFIQVSGILLGNDCNSFALVLISCGVAHHKIGLELIFAAQKGEEIPPIFVTGGVIFVEMACGCCFGAFNDDCKGACVVSEGSTFFFAFCVAVFATLSANNVGSTLCIGLAIIFCMK